MSAEALLRERLEAAFSPTKLDIFDKSDQHRHHKTNTTGGSHFTIHIASTAFDGKSAIAAHRMIYDVTGDLIPETIHALSIKIY